MEKALAVANATTLANMAMMMYKDSIVNLTMYTCAIELSIQINTDTMNKDEVYAFCESAILSGTKIQLVHHERINKDYVDIEWWLF